MQKTVDFGRATFPGHRSGPSLRPADTAAQPASPVPSVERICALVDSLANTLECIRMLNEAIPEGPMRDKLEIEQANLATALADARLTATRARTGKTASGKADFETPALPIARTR